MLSPLSVAAAAQAAVERRKLRPPQSQIKPSEGRRMSWSVGRRGRKINGLTVSLAARPTARPPDLPSFDQLRLARHGTLIAPPHSAIGRRHRPKVSWTSAQTIFGGTRGTEIITMSYPADPGVGSVQISRATKYVLMRRK